MIKGRWPDDFDVRTDPVFQAEIKPFIDEQLALLKQYDQQRIKRQQADPDTIPPITYRFYEHAFKVADDVARTCAAMGLPDNVQANMHMAMLMHDIGKHTLPIHMWDMKEKPTGDIKRARRDHTSHGVAMVEERFHGIQHPFLTLMVDIMRHHHEHMDGTGHMGFSAPDLSPPVRLACIVESYDGYATQRPHFGNRDLSPRGVLEKMRNEEGKGAAMFDMDLFEHFARMKTSQPAPAPIRPKGTTI